MTAPSSTQHPPFAGLTEEEAGRRRAAGQGNNAEIRAGRSYSRIVRDNVFNFINNLFYFLGILLLVLGKPLDAFAVVFIIAANTLISLVQEIRAKRIMDKMTILMRPKAMVVRDEELREVDPSQIVVGDVLFIQPGDQVVVDGPLLSQGRIELDESLLTGEADAVSKRAGELLMSGSFCTAGGGYYCAEKVGLESFANKLTAKATAYKRELTPLQRQVTQVVRILLIVVIVFEALVWLRNVVGGIPFVESVRMSTVILALIPNGLVLSIALTYALGAMRLLGRDMLVQQASAVESLSNVDVLCTDKTGTLTTGAIRFEELRTLGDEDEQRATSLLATYAASTADANQTIEALRGALPSAAEGTAEEALFSSERKWGGLVFNEGAAQGTYVLGAPEIIAPQLLGEASWRTLAEEHTARGLRVLLFAGCAEPLTFGERNDTPTLPNGLKALALLFFSDELRPGVRKTLESFATSGIDVKIISGDNPHTVSALATQAGLHRRAQDDESEAPGEAEAGGPSAPGQLVAVAGDELAAMDEEAFSAAAERTQIFGRVTPEQKQDLVLALRKKGHYVAMVGDGVNDVIALKQANVAVAMQGGSQAARSVGDLILTKNTFAPLPFAFREGQRIINGMNNILRIFMVRIFFKAFMIAIITALGSFPFAPRQSALLSFFGATVPALVFALWAKPGPTPKVGLFKLLARFVVPATLLMTAMATGVYLLWAVPAKRAYLALNPTAGQDALMQFAYPPAQTALTIFACFAAIFLIMLVVPPSPWWAGGTPESHVDNRIYGVVAFLFVVMATVLTVPLGRILFELQALPPWQYLVLFALAAIWSLLCRAIWRSKVLDRWLGTAENPSKARTPKLPHASDLPDWLRRDA